MRELYDDGTQGLVFLRNFLISTPYLLQNSQPLSDTFHFHKACNLRLRSVQVHMLGDCHITVTSKEFDKFGMQLRFKVLFNTTRRVRMRGAGYRQHYPVSFNIHGSNTERTEVTVTVSSVKSCVLSYHKSGERSVWNGVKLYTTGKSINMQSILVERRITSPSPDFVLYTSAIMIRSCVVVSCPCKVSPYAYVFQHG